MGDRNGKGYYCFYSLGRDMVHWLLSTSLPHTAYSSRTPTFSITLSFKAKKQRHALPECSNWFLLAQFCLQELELTKDTHSPFGSWLTLLLPD